MPLATSFFLIDMYLSWSSLLSDLRQRCQSLTPSPQTLRKKRIRASSPGLDPYPFHTKTLHSPDMSFYCSPCYCKSNWAGRYGTCLLWCPKAYGSLGLDPVSFSSMTSKRKLLAHHPNPVAKVASWAQGWASQLSWELSLESASTALSSGGSLTSFSEWKGQWDPDIAPSSLGQLHFELSKDFRDHKQHSILGFRKQRTWPKFGSESICDYQMQCKS
jgi:hypothetical protein